jgi:outer membrane protein assembly factor BamB
LCEKTRPKGNGSPNRLRTAVRGIGLRLVVLAAVAAVAVLLCSDLRNAILARFIQPSADADAGTGTPAALADSGNDWPHLRGPTYDGHGNATGLADSWPSEGPPVLWARDIGTGYSAIIAVGDRLFTQTQGLYRQSVLCLDAKTGRTIWKHDYAWPYGTGGMYPGPRSTPTWCDGRIYFVGPRAVLGCLRATDGTPIWTADLEERFGCQGTDFGYAASPLVVDGKVIIPVGAKGASLVALDAADGSTVWTGGDQPASYCGAAPITFAGKRLVLVFLQNALAIHDLASGEVAWLASYSQGYDEHAAMPIHHDGKIMIASPFRSGSRLYRIERATDAKKLKAKEVWSSSQMSNDVASSVLADGCVFGFDLRDIQTKARRPSRGVFRAIDFATGKSLWNSGRTGHAAAIVADGKLFMLNDRGEAILAAASPDGYRELGRVNIFGDEICWTSPTLSRDRLYLRSPTRAACLYVGKPENLTAAQQTIAQPAATLKRTSRVDLSWAVGGERKYPFDAPDRRELWRWFCYSLLGVFVPATALAALVWAGVYFFSRRPRSCRAKLTARRAARIVFWAALAAGGVIATPIFNRLGDEFVFTWPVVLFVAQQVVLTSVVAAAKMPNRIRSIRICLAASIMFFAVCLLYFDACRRLDLAMQWVFLIGFLPSWPAAVPAAYLLRRDLRPWCDVVLAPAAFSAYFWGSAAFVAWRLGGL